MIIAFFNGPTAAKSADKISLNAFIEEIVLNGLKTLKERSELRLAELAPEET